LTVRRFGTIFCRLLAKHVFGDKILSRWGIDAWALFVRRQSWFVATEFVGVSAHNDRHAACLALTRTAFAAQASPSQGSSL
jgi:hypothetical protein